MLHNFSAGWEIIITAKKREALQERLLQISWWPGTASPHLSHQCSLPHLSERYSQCPRLMHSYPMYSPIDRRLGMKEFVFLIKIYLIFRVMQGKDRVNIRVGYYWETLTSQKMKQWKQKYWFHHMGKANYDILFFVLVNFFIFVLGLFPINSFYPCFK